MGLATPLKPADPNDLGCRLDFDGRIAEDFKLASGTWAASVRCVRASSRLARPLVRDVVIAGINRDESRRLSCLTSMGRRRLINPTLPSVAIWLRRRMILPIRDVSRTLPCRRRAPLAPLRPASLMLVLFRRAAVDRPRRGHRQAGARSTSARCWSSAPIETLYAGKRRRRTGMADLNAKTILPGENHAAEGPGRYRYRWCIRTGAATARRLAALGAASCAISTPSSPETVAAEIGGVAVVW